MVGAKENVILITVDSLRADFVGAYDENGDGLTPSLDEFATKSVLFENAIAQGSYTRASIPSFFTSTYPGKLEQGGDISERETIATALKRSEYNTAFFHSNPFLSAPMGYDRGFDVFDDSLLPWNLDLPQKRVRQLGRLFRIVRRTPYLPAGRIVDKSLAWLEKAGSPWFLWAHFMDPHGPYQGRDRSYREKYRAEKLWNKAVNHPKEISESERNRLMDSYRQEVRVTDEAIGRLLDSVSELEGESYVFITADHGEEFGEHGDYSHNPKPYDELIRVPFLLKGPWRSGKRGKDPIALLDIFPTVLDLVGLETDDYELDGSSLVQLIEGAGNSPRDPVVSQPEPDRICLRSERWKLIVHGEERELYDLKKDPEEQRDVSETNTAKVKQLERKLMAKKGDYGNSEKLSKNGPDSVEDDEDEERKRRLEDLGYL